MLVLSPGHPDRGGGGSERAAYSLFRRLRDDPGVAAAAFVAAAEPRAIGHEGFLGSHRSRPDELLAVPPAVDPFSLQSGHLDALAELVDALVDGFRPDVVHVHHVLAYGLEVLQLFAEAKVKVVLTLHDFVPICAHYGQMVTPSGALCHAAHDAECAACVPPATAGHFFLRRAVVREMLARADAFIAPSEFLAGRYRSWGLPGARPLAVIDNLLGPDLPAAAARPDRARTGGDAVVLGFFGQVTPFKGLDVLLDAMTRLSPRQRTRLALEIHGENLHHRGGAFGRRLSRRLEAVPEAVRRGRYDNASVVARMRGCDFVVVPSVWWENSPLVIQEARLAGRPVIASDIGGMREKTDRRTDILVPPADPSALAAVLSGIAEGAIRPNRRRARALARARAEADAGLYAAHVALYRGLLRGES